MLTAGIIAEYNPFHNGHCYQTSMARAAGATHIVAVMSGNFVQRGEPALLDKYTRAKQALTCGCDLILELPSPWSLAGAEHFAQGGCALLNELGCVNLLCFGSERGRLEPLLKASAYLQSDTFRHRLKKELSTGLPFAAARQNAAAEFLKEEICVLEQPNDILGVEYCKALTFLKSAIRPYPILRTGAGHHTKSAQGSVASAGNIRRLLSEGQDISLYLPEASMKAILEELKQKRAPAHISYGERAILYRLRTMTLTELSSLPDISEGLEHRIFHAIRSSCSLEELYMEVKTKRYSHARIRRIVLSAFLGLTAKDAQAFPSYLRVLGMNARGAELLHHAKKTAGLPLVTNSADLSMLSTTAKEFFYRESARSDLHALFMPQSSPCGLDRTAGPIIIRS